jgi:hypothetical protein
MICAPLFPFPFKTLNHGLARLRKLRTDQMMNAAIAFESLRDTWTDAIETYKIIIRSDQQPLRIVKFAKLRLAKILVATMSELNVAEEMLHDVYHCEMLRYSRMPVWMKRPELSEDAQSARDALALLMMQSKRDDEACQVLKHSRFKLRLSKEIVCYQENNLVVKPDYFCRIFDHVLPKSELEFMKLLFSEGSDFYSQHKYRGWGLEPSPYFSYLHSMENVISDRAIPLERIIRRIYNLMLCENPLLSKAKYAEWWVHCRPHSSGHQLHFDSDNEGESGVRNPIISTVLYLDAKAGGPTLITNQEFSSNKLANEACLIFPKENRIGAFDGSLLHGVIPGHGINENLRTTFMVAFWEETTSREFDISNPCANQRFPYLNEERNNSNWIQMACNSNDEMESLENYSNQVMALPQKVDTIWENLSEQNNQFPSYDEIFQGF